MVSTCNPLPPSTAPASQLSTRAETSKVPTLARPPPMPNPQAEQALAPLQAPLLLPARVLLSLTVSTRPWLVSLLSEVSWTCCCKSLGRRRFSFNYHIRTNMPRFLFFTRLFISFWAFFPPSLGSLGASALHIHCCQGCPICASVALMVLEESMISFRGGDGNTRLLRRKKSEIVHLNIVSRDREVQRIIMNLFFNHYDLMSLFVTYPCVCVFSNLPSFDLMDRHL